MNFSNPFTREVILDGDTGVSAFARLHRGPYGFLLESLEGGERWARYTFMGTEPRAVYRYRGRSCERWTPAAGWAAEADAVDPLAHLRGLLTLHPPADVPGMPRFIGGAVGYIGYDVVRTIERLPDPPRDDRALPDAVLMIADTVLVLDNLLQRATIIHTPGLNRDGSALPGAREAAEHRIEEWMARLAGPAALAPLPAPRDTTPARAETTYPAARFQDDVRRIQQYIAAGDTFQTVLSRRQDLPAPDPFTTYRYLRALNPAPYLFYLHLDAFHVVGSSPEVLVRVEEQEVTVRPIAGTRRRGASVDEDAALEAELRIDPKERAEHLMLVDLGRNDVGRVARYGSVQVRELMAVERYSHVMHLVSEVRGTLRAGLDAIAALAACFPAGTVTGAPKIRAMEIIDRLEPVRRGPYGGAVGYVGWGARSLDTAIAIRTCVIRGQEAWVQAGAGIVADSDPLTEYEETEARPVRWCGRWNWRG